VTETTLQAAIAAEATALERELAEIDMLIAQARTEATRHEQHRTQAQTKLSAATSEAPAEVADLTTQVASLARRATLMKAQVDVLEGKRKTLGRFRETLAGYAAFEPNGDPPAGDGAEPGSEGGTLRVVVPPGGEDPAGAEAPEQV